MAGKYVEILDIGARKTKAGTMTFLVPVAKERGDVKIIIYNASRSKRHWRERLCVTPDFVGVVDHIDISNSGKHRCKRYVIEGGTIVATLAPGVTVFECWDEPCPVCKDINYDPWSALEGREVEVVDP